MLFLLEWVLVWVVSLPSYRGDLPRPVTFYHIVPGRLCPPLLHLIHMWSETHVLCVCVVCNRICMKFYFLETKILRSMGDVIQQMKMSRRPHVKEIPLARGPELDQLF